MTLIKHNMVSTQAGPEKLDWASSEVQTAFQQYWTTNSSYLKAKTTDTANRISWMPDHVKDLPLFEKLGYLDVPTDYMEDFVRGGHIHPILREANWILDPSLSENSFVFSAAAPALRLVSEFLLSENFSTWWYRVRCGKRSQTSPAYLESGIEDSPSSYELVQDSLFELADHIRFTWLAEDPMGDADGSTAGSIPRLLRYLHPRAAIGQTGKSAAPSPIIALSMRYHKLLLASKYMTPSENMRLQFTLAKLILHELGHAFFVYWQGLGLECRVHETDIVNEVGFSLELALFGAILQCEGLDIDTGANAIGPMIASRIEDLFPVQTPMVSFVPMEWVQQWFRKDTWNRVVGLKSKVKLQAVTTNGVPKLFQIFRWSDGWLVPSLEHNLTDSEANMVALATNRPTKKQSKAVRDAKKHGSVAKWYETFWPKDAAKASKAAKLDECFFTPNPEYESLFLDYIEPQWLTAEERGPFELFVHTSQETLLQYISKLKV